MNKSILLTIIASLFSCLVYSQEKQLYIFASVNDNVMHTNIEKVKAILLSQDSLVLDSCWNENGYYTLRKLCYFKVNRGHYIIKTEKEGYETTYTPVDASRIRPREVYRVLPTIYMKKQKAQTIDEVVVTATKVKFYSKGDTLIYNADAFQMADGSMLDALIKQLPGAELKSDGRIFVNGRFIESLLLNGKDFFRSDNSIMLQNLPTYAVNTVKVYEKMGKLSEFAGRDMDDKEFVMDVNLKKEYNIGWMGNIDAGGANHDLYMARLFAMRSTDHSRVSIFGNMNNINDFTTPNTNDWTPDKMPYGRLTTKTVGVNVNVDDINDKFEYNGNASFTHYDNREERNTFGTNFLSGGNTYDREVQKARYCNIFLNANNSLELTPKGKNSHARYNFFLNGRYSRNRHDFSVTSATSDESWDGFEDFVTVISTPILTDDVRARLINRQIQNRYYDNKSWSTTFGTNMDYRIPYNSDIFQIGVNGTLFGSDLSDFTRKRIDYYSGTSSTDFINRYSDMMPSRGYRINANASYNLLFSDKFSMKFYYDLMADRDKSINKLYHLETLDGWGVDAEHPIGALPSVTEYLPTLDSQNSFNSVRSNNKHDFTLFANIQLINTKKIVLEFKPSLCFGILNEQLEYQRAKVDTTYSRTTITLTPKAEFEWRTKDWQRRGSLAYTMVRSTPNMLYSLNFVDDADPMALINYGSKELKNGRSHNISFNYTDRKHSIVFAPSARLYITENDVAMGYVYDRNTGRKTYSYYNINGNWSLNTNINLNGPLDKKKRLYFNSSTAWNYINSVDMIGTEMKVPAKSTVKSSVLSENLNFDYNFGRHSVGVKGSAAWVNSNGDRDDFEAINAYDFNYGIYGVAQLPLGLRLDTDITMYSRRGYDDSEMNDDNFVWNARLTRTFAKGKLTLRADAFDILHQLKKIERSINVQGRVERFYNTPPRYVLIHAIYRFNIIPKKK